MGQREVYDAVRRATGSGYKYIYVSLERIAEMLGESKKAVHRHLLKLARNGDVERIIVKHVDNKKILAYRVKL